MRQAVTELRGFLSNHSRKNSVNSYQASENAVDVKTYNGFVVSNVNNLGPGLLNKITINSALIRAGSQIYCTINYAGTDGILMLASIKVLEGSCEVTVINADEVDSINAAYSIGYHILTSPRS